MNNDLQQNDRLNEHGYEVRLGLAAPTEATLSVSPLRKDAASITSATLYGPFCKFSNTLPYKIPLRAEVNASRWTVTVPDVCYWTPNLPMHYRLTLQLADSRQLTTWVALKRFGVKGNTLSMDGERYVLRGFSTRGLVLSAGDDELWKTLRDQRSVLVFEQLDTEIVERAGWAGLPLIWDARGRHLSTKDLLDARAIAALVGMITRADSLRDPALQHAANELLWIIPASEAATIGEAAEERTQIALLADPTAALSWSRERPMIISRPMTGDLAVAERRKCCDELQAKTAELGSAAGYLLL